MSKEQILSLGCEAKKAVIGYKLCIDKIPLTQMVQMHPQLIYDYNKLKTATQTYFADKAMQYDQDHYEDQFNKKRHIWYHGPSDSGKTTTMHKRLGMKNIYHYVYTK